MGDILEGAGRPRDAIPAEEVEALIKNAYTLQVMFGCLLEIDACVYRVQCGAGVIEIDVQTPTPTDQKFQVN